MRVSSFSSQSLKPHTNTDKNHKLSLSKSQGAKNTSNKPIASASTTLLAAGLPFISDTTFFKRRFTKALLGQLIGSIFNEVTDGIFILDSAGHYVSVNARFLEITRLPCEHILGRYFSFHPIETYPDYYQTLFLSIEKKLKNLEPINELMTFAMRGGEEVFGHLRIRPCHIDENTLVYIGTLVDVGAHQHSHESLKKLRQFDSLTGLPTFDAFIDSLKVALYVANTAENQIDTTAISQLAVVRLNIDKLQSFNESLGITATDDLLKKFVERIKALDVPEQCAVRCFSRFGGDNFRILLEVGDISAAYAYLDRLSQLFEMPFFLDEVPYIYMRVSVGVALYPRDSRTVDSLMVQAESALKQARLAGGDDVVWYEKAHRNGLFQDTHLASAFNRALVETQIVPFFQPKILFNQPDVPMFEALVRWQHPILGTLSPSAFLDEVIHGMSQRLFENIITTCTKQIIAWKRLGFVTKVCINLDARQLNNDRFLQHIYEMLAKHACFANHIELELTEIARLVDKPKALSALKHLREAGVDIGIDDFGTGYASLSYLLDYPVNFIKIDKQFVENCHQDIKKQTLLKYTIDMAHALGIETIAEGVECQAELDFLKSLGCDGAQGYLFSKPLEASQATDWLNQKFTASKLIADDFNRRYPLA